MIAGSSKSLEKKLEKYIPVTESGCWLWLGATDKDGYGVIAGSINNVPWRDKAHRKSYAFHKGPIGDKHVLHICDVTGCINPNHLYLGTPLDNAIDKVKRGRCNAISRFGKDNPMYGRVGKLNPFYGKKHTPETKLKISMANRKNP